MLTQPTKEQVRHWMQERQAAQCPPPDPQQIRRELGLHLIEMERKEQAGRR